jgi:quercetin dioxygenase-like cupin family protein
MIVKSDEAKQREFMGVNFDVLAVGEKSMVTKMNYKIGDKVPGHAHPNEQSGFVISGEYLLFYNNQKTLLKKGDSYSIPENAVHGLEVISAGEIIDVFTPPRMDYL